ncbi:Domain of uncharacterised function, DUF446 [Cedecea neteri]|uniref:Domain of uncharacterized function, DUF446 n=1 Tax=Cedecea neteri TaxID=158822 RepID=A0A2X2T5V3_9ENTR|nr:Domain of uncharacterised function, DUF446 [Cedecea neteri]
MRFSWSARRWFAAIYSNIEQILRDHSLWQGLPPDPTAFESTQPFCMDTLQPHEWLQWVLIPA